MFCHYMLTSCTSAFPNEVPIPYITHIISTSTTLYLLSPYKQLHLCHCCVLQYINADFNKQKHRSHYSDTTSSATLWQQVSSLDIFSCVPDWHCFIMRILSFYALPIKISTGYTIIPFKLTQTVYGYPAAAQPSWRQYLSLYKHSCHSAFPWQWHFSNWTAIALNGKAANTPPQTSKPLPGMSSMRLHSSVVLLITTCHSIASGRWHEEDRRHQCPVLVGL